jgi:hypothetical protein
MLRIYFDPEPRTSSYAAEDFQTILKRCLPRIIASAGHPASITEALA